MHPKAFSHSENAPSQPTVPISHIVNSVSHPTVPISRIVNNKIQSAIPIARVNKTNFIDTELKKDTKSPTSNPSKPIARIGNATFHHSEPIEKTVNATLRIGYAKFAPNFLKSGPWTRIVSFVALLGVLYLFFMAGTVSYRFFSDSIVAPIILSPDADLVIQSKLNLGRLLTERQMISARIEDNKASIHAADQALLKVKELYATSERSLDWLVEVTKKMAVSGISDYKAITQQQAIISQAIKHQKKAVVEARKNLEAGLVHKSDLDREEGALRQLLVTLLQNKRDQLAADVQLHRNALTEKALKQQNNKTHLLTPEMLVRLDQTIRLELDVLRLEAERRTKMGQLIVDKEEGAKIDDLVKQMKARPIFRAIETSQNVAFVPYTQIEGVIPGATVFHCSVWGLFSCIHVGKVTELLPGEVVAQDPWGTPSRGQYAILDLSVPTAAQSKSLRIRRINTQLSKETSSTTSSKY